MDHSDKKIAIVINCYNYEDYIQSAIESALIQDQNLCEIVVIDDGSTDNSWNIINTFPLKSYRKKNGGQVSACLLGVKKTKSPFIIFLDADDELMPNAVSQLSALLDADVSKIQFPLIKIDEKGSIIGPHFPKIRQFRDSSVTKAHIQSAGTYLSPPTSGNVFRRDLSLFLEEAHYDTAVDGIMLLAAPFFGDIISLDTPLARYRIHGKNKSGIGGTSRQSTMRLHQERFVKRVEHLNNLCLQNNFPLKVLDPEKLYIFARYENYCAILNYQRISLRNVIISVRNFPKWYGIVKRLSVICFLLSSFVISKRILVHLLELRLSGKLKYFFNNIFFYKKINKCNNE